MQMQLPRIDVKRELLATILNGMRSGALQVPRFQREFVWPLSKTRALLDSLYKEFPIGTFFLWRAPRGTPPLSRPLDELGLEKPAAGTDISYILDGQQRLASLYCVVNGIRLGSRDYGRVCVDLAAGTKFDLYHEEDSNEDIFVYRTPDNAQFVAVRDLIASESALQIYEGIPPQWKPAYNKIFNLFQTYPFSVVWIQEQTLADAIVIFQRINQAGQRLGRYDLVCANLWRADFDFRKKVADVNQGLKRRGFGLIDETIFTQSFSLILRDQCTTLAELSLETDQVKDSWRKVIRALELAIDFAVNNLGVRKIEYLPYRGQLAVLAYFFYQRGERAIAVPEREMLWTWFWQVTLSERYSSTSPMRMAEDAKKMRGFISGEETTFNYPSAVTVDEILRTKMGSTSSALRNGFLCMLALRQPRNFKDNSTINLNDGFFSNLKQAERHHIFPVGYLRSHGINTSQVHLLPNFCFIPADLNKEIGKQPPAAYLSKYRDENPSFLSAIETHLIPVRSDSPVWNAAPNAFHAFLRTRAQTIAEAFAKLVDTGPLDLQIAAEYKPVLSEIDVLEVRLRDFIDERLAATVGNGYWKAAMPGDTITLVKERIADQVSRQPYLDQSDFASGRSRLDFCDVSDYEKIFMKNWDLFGDYFARKPDLQSHLAAFRNLRNATQHNRAPTLIEAKTGEAAILWLTGILDKYDGGLGSSSGDGAEAVGLDEEESFRPAGEPANHLEDPGETGASSRDTRKYDVTVYGLEFRRQAKRNAMHHVVNMLCSRGATPRKIAALLPWKSSTMFFAVDGHLDAAQFVEAASNVPGRRFDRGRWFCDSGELFYADERTFALTKMWGKRWAQSLRLLSKEYPDAQVTFESDTVIAPPESRDFIARPEAKEPRSLTVSQAEYVVFFQDLVKRLRSRIPGDYSPVQPKSYYQIPTGIGSVHYEWGFHGRPRTSFGVELHFERGDRESNLRILARLEGSVPQLENAMQEPIRVQKDWGRNWARLYAEKSEAQFTTELKEWAVDKMEILINTFQSILDRSE